MRVPGELMSKTVHLQRGETRGYVFGCGAHLLFTNPLPEQIVTEHLLHAGRPGTPVTEMKLFVLREQTFQQGRKTINTV